MKLSIFKGGLNPTSNKTAGEITEVIKFEKFRADLERIQRLLETGEHEEARNQSKNFPKFSPAGVFSDVLTEASLETYSQVSLLEFENLPPESLTETWQKLRSTPYLYMAFISPSKKGIKALVRVDSAQQEHQHAFQRVKAYYEEITGCTIGSEGACLTHLCPVSSDPNAYLNENAEYFKLSENEPHSVFFKKVFEQLLKLMNPKIQNWPEETSVHLNSLIQQCNRYGIPKEVVLRFFDSSPALSGMLSRSDFSNEVDSVYLDKHAEFAQMAELARLAISPKHRLDGMEQTPTIPQAVYDRIPNLLKQCCNVQKKTRKKDVALIGTLGLMSGCFPGVFGLYLNNNTASNLFIFVTAPAASGKGVLEVLRGLISPIHQKIKKISENEQQAYRQEVAASRRPGMPIPKQPPVRRFVIPANTSSAMIMSMLEGNLGQGMIFENEADVLQNTFKQDWGDFSVNLRNGFHHEKMSSCRKGDNNCIEVENPKISVVLSGTPQQVTSLFGSSENGLFSRFLFYSFEGGAVWESVAASTTKHLDIKQYYLNLGDTVQRLYELFEDQSIQFELPEKYCDIIDLIFSLRLEAADNFNEGADSLVKRLGLITFRIAMLLTAIRTGERSLETGQALPKSIVCTFDDFSSAIHLTTMFYEHAMLVFRALPKQNTSTVKLGTDKQTYFNNLPYRFKREEAIGAGKGVGLTPDSVDKLLRKLTKNGLLNKADYGYYQKTTNG